MENDKFKFNISLSVLNHLGRNLYRSFITVLGEAISNSWDADAKNVWINIDRDKNILVVKDDGVGMTKDDFQDKFLKIGYSKRKKEGVKSLAGRPFIGGKGIGKLALLSCAKQITVITKTKDSVEYVGGVINNAELDESIKKDSDSGYELSEINIANFQEQIKDHAQGTIIYFEDINDGIKNTYEYLTKIIALYFKFSLVDSNFKIFINDKPITDDCLADLAKETQFVWNINEYRDTFLNTIPNLKEEMSVAFKKVNIRGYIASVSKPRYLRIGDSEEKVGIDLFVNGRLRERDILKHIPTDRIAESYLYGQIHFDELDNSADIDRFTSNREGIIDSDPTFSNFLSVFKTDLLLKIIEDWDDLRRKYKLKGDPEDTRITSKDRSSEELFNSVIQGYEPEDKSSTYVPLVNKWSDDLQEDAKYNFGSYAECFVSENLIRKLITELKIDVSQDTSAKNEIDKWRKREVEGKANANISIDLRKDDSDLFYLDMKHLVSFIDKQHGGAPLTIKTDEKSFTPIRNAVMHTSLLTDEAKLKLTTTYQNMKARVKNLLNKKP